MLEAGGFGIGRVNRQRAAVKGRVRLLRWLTSREGGGFAAPVNNHRFSLSRAKAVSKEGYSRSIPGVEMASFIDSAGDERC